MWKINSTMPAHLLKIIYLKKEYENRHCQCSKLTLKKNTKVE